MPCFEQPALQHRSLQDYTPRQQRISRGDPRKTPLRAASVPRNPRKNRVFQRNARKNRKKPVETRVLALTNAPQSRTVKGGTFFGPASLLEFLQPGVNPKNSGNAPCAAPAT
jgi:hypothetical protein